MAEPDPATGSHHSSLEPEAIDINVVTEMTYYERSQPTTRGRGGKTRTQPKKLPAKVKDFEASVQLGQDSWISFLRAVLECHGETKYRVSAQKPFSVKVLVPPEKAK